MASLLLIGFYSAVSPSIVYSGTGWVAKAGFFQLWVDLIRGQGQNSFQLIKFRTMKPSASVARYFEVREGTILRIVTMINRKSLIMLGNQRKQYKVWPGLLRSRHDVK